MAIAYTLILPNADGVPKSVVVRLVAMRGDGKQLSREEMEALVKAYPPPPELSEEFANAVAASKPDARRMKTTTATKARKPAAKRAAAKRP